MKQIFILFLFLCAHQLHSQSTTQRDLITSADGLSQGYVYDILQSRDGFIWVATKDGLNRYDGSRFVVFANDPFNPYSIANSNVLAIFEDSRGWIWAAFQSGLDVYDPATGRFYHVLHDGNKDFGSEETTWLPPLKETPDGAIWLLQKDGIWKINAPNDLLAAAEKKDKSTIEPTCKLIPKPPAERWNAIESFPLGSGAYKLLIAANDGIFRIDPATAAISAEILTPGFNYSLFATDHKGMVIVSAYNRTTLQQTWTLITGSGAQYIAPPKDSGYSSFSQDGYLWILQDGYIKKWQVSSLLNQGLPDFEMEVASMINHAGGGFNKFLLDRSGVLWLCTGGYGLLRVNLKAPHFKSFLPLVSQRRFLEAPDGGIYSLFNPKVKYASTSFQSAASHTDFSTALFASHDADDWGAFSACFDAAGNGWSNDRNPDRLLRTDAQTKSVTSFPWRNGYGLIVDRSGALLSVGEKGGLIRFDPQSSTTAEFPFAKPQKKVSTFSYFLYEDIAGNIWIFGYEGLTKAVPGPSGYTFEHYINNPADRSSLSSNIVLSVADDPLEPQRYLWVGTKSGGLNRLDKQSGTFKQYKREQGLPDNVIYGILAESRPSGATQKPGFIWLSTNNGLCRFDVRAETSKNFTTADGLQDNEFNSSSYLKTRDGYMIFGGINGLTVFHPDSLNFNKNLPEIHIVGLHVNNKKYDITGKSEIALSYNQNLLTFDFAALEFTSPTKNQYRYQLVGVDKDWVSIGSQNSIQFANLAPGTYTFRVLGSNNDGAWSEKAAEIRFTIHPPWWASWWAYLIYLALAGAGIWWYYQYMLRQRFSEQEKLRLQELDDFKSRFFTNITHEFRTPLTVMLGMSEQLAKEEKDEPKRNKISLIKRSGENLLRLVNQILDLAKLESNTLKINYVQGDILIFIRYISESLHSLANAQNLMLRVESDQAKIVMDYDPERFLQIIHNLLSNAIKFTPSGGRVLLQVDVKDQWLHISVTDSGAGIPPEELPLLFERFFQARNQEHAKAGGTGIGLSLTRELVKAMGGNISVASKVGEGSTFMVQLPITNNSVFDEMPTGRQQLPTDKRPFPNQPTRRPAVVNDPDRPNILLVEDNPDVVEYLYACLKDHFNLDFAYNGQVGIEKALETVPDLIVSDVMMPFKDGFEVVEALKNDERASHIPIILLTAKADVQSRLAGLRRGADAYLSKPFHQEELLVTVENLLELRRKLQLKYQQNVLTSQPPGPGAGAVDPEDNFLQKVREIIEEQYHHEDFGLPQLCQKIGMSRSQLFRKIKALTDISPSDLIRTHRLNKARTLLESGAANVAEAAWQVGFKDPSYFSKLFQEEFGEEPRSTRK